jgi:ABC-type spermidine/putrescine transport system permease subunit I
LLSSDSLYLFSYLKSLQIAAFSTAILLTIGYPIAYGMARAPRAWHPLLVIAVVLPFWTSFLIRVYAWINILQRDGLLNDVLMRLHVIDVPVAWLPSDTAIYIGMVYSYLPFMVLPLYAALEKIDETLLEAAADLGCSRSKAFWLVTMPLSLPGVAAGAVYVAFAAPSECVSASPAARIRILPEAAVRQIVGAGNEEPRDSDALMRSGVIDAVLDPRLERYAQMASARRP